MATKGLETLYNWAKSTGYERSIDDFYNLISTNKDAFNRVYSYAKETGYERDENAFASLVGIQMSPPVKPIGPSKEGDAPTPSNEGGGAEEQPMSAAPETSATETVAEQPMPDAKAAALEADLNNKLLPVTENTVIKEVPAESDKMVIKSPEKKKDFLEAADEILYKIYNSPGYLKKLENEIAQSKGETEYDPKELDELEFKLQKLNKEIQRVGVNSKEYEPLMKEFYKTADILGAASEKEYYIGGKYNAADLINERRKRVETTKVTLDNDPESGAEAGVMRASYANKEPWKEDYKPGNTLEEKEKIAEEQYKKEKEFKSKGQPINTDIVIYTEPHRKNYPSEDYKSELMATAIEEKEHSSHIPLVNPSGISRSIKENITPYAEKIVMQNAIVDDGYLNDPTEVIAKKRATEVNLIGQGLLNPGENANESHFKELLSIPDLPYNVTQLLQTVSGIEGDGKGPAEVTKEVQEKILNDPKLYKEALERWLNIMNKIAFNDKQSFDINPFGIDKTKTV